MQEYYAELMGTLIVAIIFAIRKLLVKKSLEQTVNPTRGFEFHYNSSVLAVAVGLLGAIGLCPALFFAYHMPIPGLITTGVCALALWWRISAKRTYVFQQDRITCLKGKQVLDEIKFSDIRKIKLIDQGGVNAFLLIAVNQARGMNHWPKIGLTVKNAMGNEKDFDLAFQSDQSSQNMVLTHRELKARLPSETNDTTLQEAV